MTDCWNHNVHYQRLIINAVPPACATALDVGCGDGTLVRALASRCGTVIGIDSDETMIDIARRNEDWRGARDRDGGQRDQGDGGQRGQRNGGEGDGGQRGQGDGDRKDRNGQGEQRFVRDDFLRYPFDPGSFDFVCANTSLHHMDFASALRKLAAILRPGGRLAVVGLGRDAAPADWLASAAAMPVNWWYRVRYEQRQHSAMPVRGPDMTWAQVRDTAEQILPGAAYRRLLLWRYLLVWDKPRD